MSALTRTLWKNASSLCSLQHCACSGCSPSVHPVISAPALLALSGSPASLYFISLMFKILFNRLKSSKPKFFMKLLCVFNSCLLSWELVFEVQTLWTTVPHSLGLIFSVFDTNACCTVYACTLSVRLWPISWWPTSQTSCMLLLQTNSWLSFEAPHNTDTCMFGLGSSVPVLWLQNDWHVQPWTSYLLFSSVYITFLTTSCFIPTSLPTLHLTMAGSLSSFL